MAKIIESVPNISEGRDTAIIEACVDQIRQTPGCTLLQYSSDTSHNRTVITYMGSPEAVDAEYARLTALGVASLTGEPVTRPWGQRNFFFVDPEGNYIEIGS